MADERFAAVLQEVRTRHEETRQATTALEQAMVDHRKALLSWIEAISGDAPLSVANVARSRALATKVQVDAAHKGLKDAWTSECRSCVELEEAAHG